tara:strand:+ start:292 stop:498 length:207 start_codon:yes stop_codon:yes gene_type:complete
MSQLIFVPTSAEALKNITDFVLAKLIRFQNKKRMSGAKKYPTKTEIKGGLCLAQKDAYSSACEEDIGA